MEAPPESFAYTLLLSPDFSKPDALAVIDVRPGSPTFSQVVHTVTMPIRGTSFTTSAGTLARLRRRSQATRSSSAANLIVPGIRHVDTKPDPTKAHIHKIIEPEEFPRG
jgi:selenium-binding protein 1